MPNTGTGWGTPVGGGGIGSASTAMPYPHTLLPLQTYGRMMGINPLHFSGALTPGLDPVIFPDTGCDSIWKKYDWQDIDKVSLYQLAQLIHDAEQEVMNIIGYPVAPLWLEEEHHSYPRPFLREAYGTGYDVRGRKKSIITEQGKIIQAGQRAVTYIGTATKLGASLVFSDNDGDGYAETATVTLPTTETNINELKLYFTGTGGSLDWEIRPVRSKRLTGGNVEFVLDSWLLINPELYELPTTSDGLAAIDVSTTNNYVDEVDIYREYSDVTSPSAVFYWDSDGLSSTFLICPSCGTINCTNCAYDAQNGCAIARSPGIGELAVYPATYDADSASWIGATWSNCIEPDIVKVYYLAGDQSQEYLQGRVYEPLSHFWAQTIAWIATARIDRPVCACGNVHAAVEDLRRDMSKSEGRETYFLPRFALESPFGTRKGEVMAWRRIAKASPARRMKSAVI
jgi:hypothetical protein